ncbi:hypothetical protein AB0B31_13985 [Catellatospora citrea]|uniref:hypothetical protein n=1 Tax=Catellatospora citrea TaxID=53366 RepID=UPI0033D2A21C
MNGRRSLSALALAAALTLPLTLIGCAGAGEEQREPAIGEIKQVNSYKDIVMPLDVYILTREQRISINNARELLIRDCVNKHGLQVTGRVASGDQPSRQVMIGRRYGIIDADAAARTGYRADAEVAADAGKAGGGWNPTPEEFRVVSGKDQVTGENTVGQLVGGTAIAEGGCASEAGRQLSADGGELASNYGDTLQVETYAMAERDSRVVAAVAEWSKCMAEAGYTYSSPWEPNNRDWGPKPTNEEIATAVADVACRRKVDLVGIWLAVESAYQQRVIDENHQRLEQSRQAYEVQLRNASKIVAG